MRSKVIELARDILQKSGQIEPPVDVEALVQNLGIRIKYEPLEDQVSGYLVRRGNNAVIGINALHSSNRQRFSIAHELGHFVMHSSESRNIFVDEVYVKFRDTGSSEGVLDEEVEANTFAAELLMPEDQVRCKVVETSQVSEVEIKRLASAFSVSPMAMTYRLVNLGFLETPDLFQMRP